MPTKHRMCGTKTYRTWEHIIDRCTNKNRLNYHNYGGRGITVCKKWVKFENFFEDMGERPKGLSIERIDNDKGYYKENCKWATYTEQSRNQRIRKTNKTGVKGVYWHKGNKAYVACISMNYKNIYLGHFKDLATAAKARKQGELKYWGKEILQCQGV